MDVEDTIQCKQNTFIAERFTSVARELAGPSFTFHQPVELSKHRDATSICQSRLYHFPLSYPHEITVDSSYPA
jgi:hypothetical protein